MPVRLQDAIYILWRLLTLELVISQVSGRQHKVNMITPNPVVIGSPMTVTCAAWSVGGREVLDLDERRGRIENVRLYYNDSTGKHEELAELNILWINRTFEVKPNQPGSLDDSNYEYVNKIPYKTFYPWINNYKTTYMRLTVPVMTCDIANELMTTYYCEFDHWRDYHDIHSNGTGHEQVIKTFEETAKIDVYSDVDMSTSSPAPDDPEGYDNGETLSFTCKIDGDHNMRVEWEASECQNPKVFGKEYLDPDANNNVQTKDLNAASCDQPSKTYTTQLTLKTSSAICFIRCVVYDKDGCKMEKYKKDPQGRIVNGTVSVATNGREEEITTKRTRTQKPGEEGGNEGGKEGGKEGGQEGGEEGGNEGGKEGGKEGGEEGGEEGNEEDAEDQSKTGYILGIAFGGLVAIILVVIIPGFVFWRKRKNKRNQGGPKQIHFETGNAEGPAKAKDTKEEAIKTPAPEKESKASSKSAKSSSTSSSSSSSSDMMGKIKRRGSSVDVIGQRKTKSKASSKKSSGKS